MRRLSDGATAAQAYISTQSTQPATPFTGLATKSSSLYRMVLRTRTHTHGRTSPSRINRYSSNTTSRFTSVMHTDLSQQQQVLSRIVVINVCRRIFCKMRFNVFKLFSFTILAPPLEFRAVLCFTADVFFYFFAERSPSSVGRSPWNFAT